MVKTSVAGRDSAAEEVGSSASGAAAEPPSAGLATPKPKPKLTTQLFSIYKDMLRAGLRWAWVRAGWDRRYCNC